MGTIHRRREDGAWDGIEPVAYALPGVVKHELFDAPGYRMRVFEVQPGRRTAHESHPHDHAVLVLEGRGRVTLGEHIHDVAPGDAVYVEGDEEHCFEAAGDEPLRFVCVSPPRT